MFNKVILVGNLTRDIELRYLPNGSALAKLGLATNRRYKKQDGTQAEETCFIDVNLFGRTAEVANQYLKRGSQVLIEGRLVLESWMDSNGQKKSRHSITAESMQMLGRPQNLMRPMETTKKITTHQNIQHQIALITHNKNLKIQQKNKKYPS